MESFVKALRRTGVEFDDIDLADALWLAAAMMDAVDENLPVDIETEHQPEAESNRQKPVAAQKANEPARPSERPPSPPLGDSGQSAGRYDRPPVLIDQIEQQESIVAPTSDVLPQRLNIARALRPFKRLRASHHFVEFDEEATVRRYADTGFLYPVMRPGKERWFDVAVVVDESMSMVVWEETVAELVKVFAFHGAFRDVHRWSLREESGRAVVHNEMGLPTGTHNLVDPGGRRLVLMITDCVADMWYRPRIWQLLQTWGKSTPVGIVQMLPARIWPTTGLGSANIEMFGTRPGAPNSEQFAPLPFWLETPTQGLEAIPVPAISLDASAVGSWARVTMGSGTSRSRAVVKTTVNGHNPNNSQLRKLSPFGQVEAFRTRVPAAVWQLTIYLSLAPLRLAVMRLVQQAMMPETGHAELAEFLIGGLVRRVSGEQKALNGDDIEFEFIDGVREELNGIVDQTETLTVYHSIARHLERTTGTAPGFSALILGKDIDPDEVPESLKPFIKVSEGVFERVGLRESSAPEKLDTQETINRLGENLGSSFQSEQETAMPEDFSSKAPQPAWDAALIVGVSNYEVLGPLDSATNSASEFGEWLCSSPGPNMDKERVRVLQNPLHPDDIRDAFLALHERTTDNPDQLFVIAMFGRTEKGPKDPVLCLPNFNPERPTDIFDYHALLDQLILGGAWDQYLCIVDGTTSDVKAEMAMAMDPFASMRNRIVESSPGERYGLTLSRKPRFTDNFLRTLIDAFNYKARDVDGYLRQQGLIDHLKHAVDVRSYAPGLNVLLDESSENLPSDSNKQASQTPGFGAALVVGSAGETSSDEELYETGLIATWLLQPSGFNLHPHQVQQLQNPTSPDQIYSSLEKTEDRQDAGGTLLVYLTGNVVTRNGTMYFTLGSDLPTTELDLDYLYERIRQVPGFTNVMLVVNGKTREVESIFPGIPPASSSDPQTEGLRIVALDWEHDEFSKVFINGFANTHQETTWVTADAHRESPWINSNGLIDFLSKTREIDVSMDGPVGYVLGPAQSEEATRVQVLSRDSVFVCEHGSGRVVLPKGDGPLLIQELNAAPIEGCVIQGETGRACTRVIGTDEYGSTGLFGRSNESYVFDNVRVISDGAPARFDTEEADEDFAEENAYVLLDETRYVDLIDFPHRNIEQPPEYDVEDMDLKWPVVSLTIDLIATRTGSSVLIRRPRLERDTAVLFDAGEETTYRNALQPRFEFLANRKKQNNGTFVLDLLVVSEMSAQNTTAVSNILNNQIKRIEDNRPPLLQIENAWFNTIDQTVPGSTAISSSEITSEIGLQSNLKKLNVATNRQFGPWQTTRIEETKEKIDIDGLLVSVLGPRPKQYEPPLDSSNRFKLNQGGLILQFEFDNLKVLLSGSASPETLLECIGEKPRHVNVMQLPPIPYGRVIEEYETTADELFNRISADHYLVSDSSDAQKTTEETYQTNLTGMLERLLRSRPDSVFTVYHAINPDQVNLRVLTKRIKHLFEQHPSAKLVMPELDTTHTTIDLLPMHSNTSDEA